MAGGFELKIDGDLFAAVRDVLGAVPETPEPVLVLAVYVHSLAKGYGLSESQLLPESERGRATVPAPARALVAHFLPDDDDALRDRLYDVFVALSEDPDTLKSLNRNAPLTEVGARKMAQVFWNLETTKGRPLLPIPTGQTVTLNGKILPADIKVPRQNKDYGTMLWAERMRTGVEGLGAGQAYKSSGQGLRTKGARLAVLAALHLVASNPEPAPSLEGVALAMPDQQNRRASIVWPDEERVGAGPAPLVTEPALAGSHPEGVAIVADIPGVRAQQVIVGMPAGVGPAYQRRGFDDEIDRVWSEEGERRVWLRGGPGLGKSYTARRVMRDAIAQQDDASERLLIWVDSATPQSVREAYTAAVDSMPQLGVSVATEAPDRVERQSRALLTVLARSTWRWLIVLDNADAGGLIDAGLIPPGVNPNGRVLITTLSRDHRMAANGRVIAVDQFTPEEAEAYLRAQLDPTTGRPAALARASITDTTALAAAVGRHPLALSIAAATIATNAMDVNDWMSEFRTAETMDAAADASDSGGYPHLIGATWKLALDRASLGMPEGLVERAAMVAALQDPDGHPTWLWDRDTVTTWVTGGPAVPRHHGVPEVVQRLIDHGILELRGETWRQGTVAIHQLAARAVRELADTESLAALANVLTNEWLLQVTDREAPAKASTLHGNVQPITALQVLPEQTRQADTALLSYDSPPSLVYVSKILAPTLDEFAPYLRQGGVIGLAELADNLVALARKEQALSLASRADARFAQAEEIYLGLLDDDTVPDDLRAVHIRRLSELQDMTGRSKEARETRARAISLYERLTENDTNKGDFESLVALIRLHERNGNTDRANQLLALVDKYSEHAESAEPAVADPAAADYLAAFQQGETLRSRAKQLRSLRRNDKAAELLAQAVELFGIESPPNHGGGVDAAFAGRELADIHIETGRWHAAAECLTQVVAIAPTTDNLVLLASVQKRLGRNAEATATIIAAAPLRPDLTEPSESEEGEFVEKLRGLLRAIWKNQFTELLRNAAERKRFEDAAGLATGLLQIVQQHAEVTPGDHEQDLADAHDFLGIVHLQLRRPHEAMEHLTKSSTIIEVLAGLEPGNEKLLLKLARSLEALGTTALLLGSSDDATAHLGRSILLWQQLLERLPADGTAIRGLAGTLSLLGAVHFGANRPEDAIDCYLRCAQNWQTLADVNVDALVPQRGLANALWDLGVTYLTHDRPADAVSPLTRSVDAWQTVIQLAPDDHATRTTLGRVRVLLGSIHYMLDDIETAWSLAPLAVADLQVATQDDPDNLEAQGDLADAFELLSVLNNDQGHLADAADSAARAVNIYQLLADLDPGKYEPKLLTSLGLLAELQRELGRDRDASTSATRIEDLVRRFPELNE